MICVRNLVGSEQVWPLHLKSDSSCHEPGLGFGLNLKDSRTLFAFLPLANQRKASISGSPFPSGISELTDGVFHLESSPSPTKMSQCHGQGQRTDIDMDTDNGDGQSHVAWLVLHHPLWAFTTDHFLARERGYFALPFSNLSIIFLLIFFERHISMHNACQSGKEAYA